MRYHHRVIEPILTQYLKLFPVVGITGPRQSGKSTLLQKVLGKPYQYLTFDDQATVDSFYHDPKRFINQYPEHVIFDEVQKAPEIFNVIKIAVDEDRQNYGKFVLTGSSQFSFIKKITESLAGRIGLLNLLPFQYSEIPKTLRHESIYHGCYPELINRHYEGWEQWYSSYLTTYLEKDLRTVSEIGDIRDFSRFIRLLAARTAQTINLSQLANDIGIAVSTVKRWLSVLEASYIIFLVPPYYKNYGKRIIKSPKLYFYDTGLVAHLTRIRNRELFENGPLTGELFENYVIAEINKKLVHTDQQADLYYYRTNHGIEIDLIVDWGQWKEAIEIKFSDTFRPKMIQHLPHILEKEDKGYLLYNGKSMPAVAKTQVLNYQEYLSSD